MSDIRHLTSDVWHHTCDNRSLKSDVSQQTFEIRHLKSDNWHQMSYNHTGKRLKSKLNCEISVTTDSKNTLCNVESAALLGLEIDSKLSFNAHVNKIIMQNACLTNCSAAKKQEPSYCLVSFLNSIMWWSVTLWAMIASSGLHATRSSSIMSLNCKSRRQESFFMQIARCLLFPSITNCLRSCFMNNQRWISALLFITILMDFTYLLKSSHHYK